MTRMELYQQGLSDREIADKLVLSKQTVYIWRIKNNLPSNLQTRRKKKHSERMELYRQGLTDRGIAERLGIDCAVVRSWRNRNCLPVNSNGGSYISKQNAFKKLTDEEKQIVRQFMGRLVYMYRKARASGFNGPFDVGQFISEYRNINWG